MRGAIYVLLPPTAGHLAAAVREAGAVPIVDATGARLPEVPEGAWLRTRPGRPCPGTGPVVLAELGAPIPDRETWLETSVPRDVPTGFAGLVLKGREAGGWAGEEDGLKMLADCPEPGRVILDACVGPLTAGAAAALGAGGVIVHEPLFGCAELALPTSLDRRLDLSDAVVSRVVQGVRVANGATSPVLRALHMGDDPWSLADGLWSDGDLERHPWMAGQGLALARALAQRESTLGAVLARYVEAWATWPLRVRRSVAVDAVRTATTAAGLAVPEAAAASGGIVGSAVLWQEAAWIGRPIAGAPLLGAVATGLPVAAPAADVERARAQLLERAEQLGLPTEPEPEPEPAPEG
jgi:hypothetical protein